MKKISFYEERTVKWDDSKQSVVLIDQSKLPTRLEFIQCSEARELVDAIKTMKIRGAPAIGVAGAMGVALSAISSNAKSKTDFLADIAKDVSALKSARPTAVNLSWGVDRVMQFIESEHTTDNELKMRIVDFVKNLADADVAANKKLSDQGAKLFRSGESVLTHCN